MVRDTESEQPRHSSRTRKPSALIQSILGGDSVRLRRADPLIPTGVQVPSSIEEEPVPEPETDEYVYLLLQGYQAVPVLEIT